MKKAALLTTALLASAVLFAGSASAFPEVNTEQDLVMPNAAAYTIAVIDGNNINFEIGDLQSNFVPGNYDKAQWSTSNLARDGQATAPSGALASVNSKTGNSNIATYQNWFNDGKVKEGTVIYGAVKAANGLWYRAGACTVNSAMTACE